MIIKKRCVKNAFFAEECSEGVFRLANAIAGIAGCQCIAGIGRRTAGESHCSLVECNENKRKGNKSDDENKLFFHFFPVFVKYGKKTCRLLSARGGLPVKKNCPTAYNRQNLYFRTGFQSWIVTDLPQPIDLYGIIPACLKQLCICFSSLIRSAAAITSLRNCSSDVGTKLDK